LRGISLKIDYKYENDQLKIEGLIFFGTEKSFRDQINKIINKDKLQGNKLIIDMNEAKIIDYSGAEGFNEAIAKIEKELNIEVEVLNLTPDSYAHLDRLEECKVL